MSTERAKLSLIFEHSSGGKLYQSGILGVPEKPADLGISLLVVAYPSFEEGPLHKNVLYTPFLDREDMNDWEWAQIEKMLIPAVREMARLIRSGQSVLSVCRAGINRSSLISGLLLREITELSPEAIIDLIRERRDPECLNNEDFRKVVLYGF